MTTTKPGLANLLLLSVWALETACAAAPPAATSQAGMPSGKSATCATEVVTTNAGKVCGTVVDGQTRAYLGIPYAESTAGERRWTAPVPKRPWPNVFMATQAGPVCPQPMPGNEQSEDCLSINVWTPRNIQANAGLAVLVSFHGGAFEIGSGSAPLLDGSALASRGQVVVVSMNYRLGVLGFLAAKGLAGNYGFLDQQLALEWVRDNIRAFGGDPQKVTLLGQSAGAMSVGLHLVSAPKSAPLFRAAIMQSNFLGVPYKTRVQAERSSRVLMAGLGCRDVPCMRRLDAKTLVQGLSQFRPLTKTLFRAEAFSAAFDPYLDGTVLVTPPTDPSALRRMTKPLILGTTRHEAVLFYAGPELSPMQHVGTIASYYWDRGEEVLARYPLQTGSESWLPIANLITQRRLQCPSRRLALDYGGPVYQYLFDHSPSLDVTGVPACHGGKLVCHNAELPFVYGSAAKINGALTPEETNLSTALMGYWTSFAKTLDPNRLSIRDSNAAPNRDSNATPNPDSNAAPNRDSNAAPNRPTVPWPPFSATKPQYLRMNLPRPVPAVDPLHDECTFLESAAPDEVPPHPLTAPTPPGTAPSLGTNPHQP